MAISNKERVGRGLDILRGALRPVVEQELRAVVGENWADQLPDGAAARDENGAVMLDTQALLKAIIHGWENFFAKRFPPKVKNLAYDIREIRNRLAHEEPFPLDDAFAALHSIQLTLPP